MSLNLRFWDAMLSGFYEFDMILDGCAQPSRLRDDFTGSSTLSLKYMRTTLKSFDLPITNISIYER